MSDCAFCSEEIRKRLIEEGKYSVVFLSNPKLTVGHLLIVPKRHVHIFSDLKKEEILEMSKFLAKYQDEVLKKLASGTEIRQNFRPHKHDSKTHVNHFHYHILPRNEDDEIAKKVDANRTHLYTDLTKKEREKLTKLLK